MIWEYEPIRDKYEVPSCEMANNSKPANHRIHSHQNSEVLFVRRGELHVRLYDTSGEFHELKLFEGDAVMINCNIIHSTYSPMETIDYMLVFIMPSSLMPALRLDAGETLAAPINDSDGYFEQLMLFMHRVQFSKEYEKSVHDALLVSLANSLTAFFLPELKRNPLRLHCGNTRLEAVDYVCNNYKNPDLSVELLARAFGYSTRRLTDIFAENIGMNPKRYINTLRINDAVKLLLSTDDSIETVAREVGYECPRSFYRVFREITGVTPSEYRRRAALKA